MNERTNSKWYFIMTVCVLICLISTLLCSCTENGGDAENAGQNKKTPPESVSVSSPAAHAEENSGSDDGGLYDTTPVSDAYLSGDSSGLDDFQLAVLNAAKEVISTEITPEMTDYEKELAIHDHMILNISYDDKMLGFFETHDENSVNPYGALINGKAICSGYTSTFQMFMDMLEIPCMSVQAADISGEEHAWNIVQIGGGWYYVDVTWDDPIPESDNALIRHKYFNVSDSYMSVKHEWEGEDYPRSSTLLDSYIAHNLHKISELGEIPQIMSEQLDRQSENVYLEFDDSLGIALDEADGIDSYHAAKDLGEDLDEILGSAAKENGLDKVRCQRIEYGGRMILAVYMIKN